MQEQGWVKVFRTLLDKPIWLQSTPEQKTILITLLLMANHKDKEWEWNGDKFSVKPGQFITSLDGIVKKCGKGISIKNVRTGIDRFEKLEFLTNKSTKTGRLITIVNWGVYQNEDIESGIVTGKEVAKEGQSTGKEAATNKNDNNVKNDNKIINTIPYMEIFNLYLEQEIVKHKSLTEKMKESIRKALNKYTVQEVKLAIFRYGTMYHDNTNSYAKDYCKYAWTLQELLTREKGISEFLDEGGKWIRYNDSQSLKVNQSWEEGFLDG
ncbi:hypothetical protein HMPREF1982_02671 [Clostridiales bacterium oral taxon 876 str. F0540]|nr:hypothetical protein HMPREF1982_02671 [Clostridiales bacterium oral taxon 876 str. F0540]